MGKCSHAAPGVRPRRNLASGMDKTAAACDRPGIGRNAISLGGISRNAISLGIVTVPTCRNQVLYEKAPLSCREKKNLSKCR